MAEQIAFDFERGADEAGNRTAEGSTAAAHSAPRRRKSDPELNASNGTIYGKAVNGVENGYSNGHANGSVDGYTAGYAKAVVQWDGSRLYWFDEAPPVLQYNRFVQSGYRAGMTYCECLDSIFSYHNETGNILSHLLPAAVFSVLILAGWLPAWPGFPFAFYGNVLPILLCMAGSVAYHTFMAHHHKYKLWLTLDVCGIFVVMLGGVHVVLWWGLRCFPSLQLAYCVTYYGMAMVAIVSAVRAKSALWRALPMLVLFLVRVSLTVVRFLLGAGSPGATRLYAVMEVLSFAGGLINTLRIPERWFVPDKPRRAGLFDYWLNSHQLMHILVAIAMAHLHWGATLDWLHYINDTSCPAWQGFKWQAAAVY